ncbi:MAG TPA: M3 family metallopeptidase [Nevskiaceae bacterium]|nr:M3 family metallopeptidase [Nevskiaceae bacterium]
MLSQLPAFDRFNPTEAQAELDKVLAQNRSELAELLKRESHSWETLIEPLEDTGDRISRVWGPTAHLFSVWSTPEWRAAYNAGLPKVTEYGVELSQNEALYRAYQSIHDSPAFASFSPARKKVVTDALRDFRLAGVALPAKDKERFKAISLRLSELHAKFEEHLMDCVQAWSKHVTDERELDGMTDAAKSAAREKARAKGLEGWLLTLDFPSYDAVISKSTNRALRRELYEAYATRASEQGPHDRKFDNTALMSEILALRDEQAKLLGFSNFAELSLATKMAESPDEVEKFLRDLAIRAKPRAQAELDELRALAREDGIELEVWDTAFYSERLRQRKLGLSDEALRPYFPFPQVVRGMFDLVERLYDVKIEPVGGIPTWHADVTTYALKYRDGETFGIFYLDPYARPATKRGGAWMDECVVRRKLAGGVQIPAAYLVCNFTPPLGGQPALLNHDEVLTLFHEFGHGLHHLLTRVDEASVAGIRGVAWDAVELPSQFMENWAYEPAILKLFAKHWQTGEVMPDAMIEKLRADRQFQTGLATVRQLEFSLFDLLLHRDYDAARGARVQETLDAVRRDVAVMTPPSWNRMPNSFSHIFAGGYAAGYYSYKWAEVLSSDAFAAFEESNFSAETGLRFRDTVLAQGGSREAMELFIAFRGRKPNVDALLRHSGLSAA